MINIAKPLIGEEEIVAVNEVLKSGRLAQGPKVAEFEEAFAKYCGTKYAVATSSGTTALHVALLAAGIKPGDDVLVPSFSFIASANAIRFCGAKPVFVDIDPKTFNMETTENIEKYFITDKTKAIMPVHLYGQCAEMDKINEIAKKHNLVVIEDACQAHGAEYKGKKAGSLGTAGCFSFYPTKNMTTGEGGMITTNNEELAEKARLLRSHGEKTRYNAEILGFNFRMTEMAAAMGLVQLKKLDIWNEKRRKNAAYYDSVLKEKCEIPYVAPGNKHCYHQYTIKLKDRDKVMEKLKEKGVGSCVYYPIEIHKQKVYWYKLILLETDKVKQEVLSIPVHPGLSEEEVKKVAEAVLDSI